MFFQDYLFAATSVDQCYCGNSVSDIESVNDAYCTAQCPGDNEQTCGSPYFLDVYTSGE